MGGFRGPGLAVGVFSGAHILRNEHHARCADGGVEENHCQPLQGRAGDADDVGSNH